MSPSNPDKERAALRVAAYGTEGGAHARVFQSAEGAVEPLTSEDVEAVRSEIEAAIDAEIEAAIEQMGRSQPAAGGRNGSSTVPNAAVHARS